MSDQSELFDRSKERVCPFAKKHDSPNVCALEKYVQHIEAIRRHVDYLHDQTRDLIRRLERNK